ncbi:5-formyltetrahydrofolate cyclo-ligase [Nakamurella antarctica]|uniref:5-formyltetrahydrofolate cyclo-ligase n=2 Tax=Nakamurella antarctica TaxID=1902245 RepID=A0A3G8ZPU3_9ACTN|nr:5-formyltetrahydrofolate cyclo-ligase [Nakamurella antarctica]
MLADLTPDQLDELGFSNLDPGSFGPGSFDSGAEGLGEEEKWPWRERLIAARKARSNADRTVARNKVLAHLAAPLAEVDTVCAFLPLASEPLGIELLDLLVKFGVTVLVPVVTGAAPLEWSAYSPDEIAVGRLGISEPTGARLGELAVLEAAAVLVPALAVDRQGYRLGRGGGHYDRTLALIEMANLDYAPALIAVVFDDELFDEVPSGVLDAPVTHVVSPDGGLKVLN